MYRQYQARCGHEIALDISTVNLVKNIYHKLLDLLITHVFVVTIQFIKWKFSAIQQYTIDLVPLQRLHPNKPQLYEYP